MNENIFNQYFNRIDYFFQTIDQLIYPEYIQFDAEFAKTSEPVPFQERLKLSYKPVREGEIWGREWESAWFHLTCSVPENFANRELCLLIHTGGEALVFDENGVPVFGLTGFSAFDSNYYKERMVIGKKTPGEKLEYFIEAAANGLFGIDQPAASELSPDHPEGFFEAAVKHLRLAVFNREAWQFKLDLKILLDLVKTLGYNDHRARRQLRTLNDALNIFNYDTENIAAARKLLKEKAFSRINGSDALKVNSIGHAHIDVGWLWPVKESVRKAARTFSSQLALLEKYPNYIFGASQAELYRMVKENYPELYSRIKKQIKSGRWEVQGGMYVEADCNLISGESMVRQFLHGKNFFMDEFGVDVKNLWLPDVFGYSAALPQIIKKSGCDYFLTQKISWSNINKFPHNSFLWQGIDGTRILTHFPPENTYNAAAVPERRIKAVNNYAENSFLDEFISLIGIGDGGGGPSEDYVERELRLHDLDGCPKSDFGRADGFFARLEQHESELDVWNGELYLELHRGTLTTQGAIKRSNRQCEQLLASLEFVASSLPAEYYPAETLDKLWKMLLVNQFHDIIPGSSIALVYKQAEKDYQEIRQNIDRELDLLYKKLFVHDENCCTFINTLSSRCSCVAELPAAWNGYAISDADGRELPVQEHDGKWMTLVNIPENSFCTLKRGGKKSAATEVLDGNILENDLVRYCFDDDGKLLSVYDKELNREFLSSPGNVLALYNDHPVNHDAWDMEIYYPETQVRTLVFKRVKKVAGEVFQALEFCSSFGKSKICQEIRLRKDSKRADFITAVDWHEDHKLLRVEFPTTVSAESASYDIQFGYIRRPTTANTSWDKAKFEVCAHRYADLSSGNSFGIALLNDCKYGYAVKDKILSLSLLRSPKYPDRFADMGKHVFTYSLLPHCGGLTQSCVMSEAAALNRPPLAAENYSAGNAVPFCRLNGRGVSLETVKKAEKSNSQIIRLVETNGTESTATLTFAGNAKNICDIDLMEWNKQNVRKIENNQISVTLSPFEIRTLMTDPC